MTTAAPAGRLYWLGSRSHTLAEVVAWATQRYAEVEGRPATWLRCHPSQEALLAPHWPGAVIGDPRVQRGTIMLGGES